MPEIAEVETVRRTLLKQINGKEIKDVKVLYNKMIVSDLNEFEKSLIKQKINDIKRRGKWLIFELDDYYLLSHLRMEGKFFLKNTVDLHVKHEHVIISFTDNTDLRYHDTRKFGKMELVKKNELQNNPSIAKQGLEPGDKLLTSNYLHEKFKNKSLPIKTLLLDQTIISGIGNIYANEILFDAKINPYKKGKELATEELNEIINSTNNIIKKAIEMGGTTIKSYTSSLGVTGRFQQCLKVHKRDNEKCYECNNLIINEKINGRSTYYCPYCQRKEEIK